MFCSIAKSNDFTHSHTHAENFRNNEFNCSSAEQSNNNNKNHLNKSKIDFRSFVYGMAYGVYDKDTVAVFTIETHSVFLY